MKQVQRLSEKTVRDTVSFIMKEALPGMGLGLLAILAISAVLGLLFEALTFWTVFKCICIFVGCFVVTALFLFINMLILFSVGKAIHDRLNPLYQKYVPEVENDEGEMEKPELGNSGLMIIPFFMMPIWMVLFGISLIELSFKMFMIAILFMLGMSLLFAIGFLLALGRKSIGEIWGGFSDRVANHAVKRFGASGD